MSDHGRLATVLAIGGYNLIQNLVLPASAYVPANLVASLGLINLARRHGCTWDDLGLSASRVRDGARLGIGGAAAAAALAMAMSAHEPTEKYLFDERAAGQDPRD